TAYGPNLIGTALKKRVVASETIGTEAMATMSFSIPMARRKSKRNIARTGSVAGLSAALTTHRGRRPEHDATRGRDASWPRPYPESLGRGETSSGRCHGTALPRLARRTTAHRLACARLNRRRRSGLRATLREIRRALLRRRADRNAQRRRVVEVGEERAR